jgi:phosphoglucosamine mutase
VIAALELMAIMQKSGKPLSRLKQIFRPFPQTQVSIPIERKRELGELPGVMKSIRSAEKALSRSGRVLVRFSGTELKVRVLVEGPDKKANDAHASAIVSELKRVLC